MKYIHTLFILFFLNLAVYAQPGDPNGGGKPVPLGGVEILLLAGGALGVRKIVSMNNKKE